MFYLSVCVLCFLFQNSIASSAKQVAKINIKPVRKQCWTSEQNNVGPVMTQLWAQARLGPKPGPGPSRARARAGPVPEPGPGPSRARAQDWSCLESMWHPIS